LAQKSPSLLFCVPLLSPNPIVLYFLLFFLLFLNLSPTFFHFPKISKLFNISSFVQNHRKSLLSPILIIRVSSRIKKALQQKKKMNGSATVATELRSSAAGTPATVRNNSARLAGGRPLSSMLELQPRGEWRERRASSIHEAHFTISQGVSNKIGGKVKLGKYFQFLFLKF
jgi:hypothetical protein